MHELNQVEHEGYPTVIAGRQEPLETDEVFQLLISGITDPSRVEKERLKHAERLIHYDQAPGKAFCEDDPLYSNWSRSAQNERWKAAFGDCPTRYGMTQLAVPDDGGSDTTETASIKSFRDDRSETGSFTELAKSAIGRATEALSKLPGSLFASKDPSVGSQSTGA